MNALAERIQEIAGEADSLLETAEGCRAANFTALQCAPELYTTFPTTSATDLAAILVDVWACELSAANLTEALTNCKKADSSPAYTASEISAAVTANMTLEFLDVGNIPTQYGGGTNNQLKMIGLAHGDLTTVTEPEGDHYLIISCLPGDYAPTQGSLIAALDNAYGINIANLAKSPAADYRSSHNCWVSTNLSSSTGKTIPYKQVIVFESTGQDAVANIPGIFAAIKEYVPTPPTIPNTGPTILSGMVSTGGAGANNVNVLEALFNGAYNLMTEGTGYNMTCFRIVSFPTAWSAPLTTKFNTLKTQHGL